MTPRPIFLLGLAVASAGVLVTSASFASEGIDEGVRVAAVQAFEAEGRVLLFLDLHTHDGGSSFLRSGSGWGTSGVVTVSGGEVSFRRVAMPVLRGERERPEFWTAGPNSSTFFPDGHDVLVHQYEFGRSVFYRWGDKGPGRLGEAERARWAGRFDLDREGAVAANELDRIRAYREREGWVTLLSERRPLGMGNQKREPTILRPESVKAAVTIDYERRTVLVAFRGEDGKAADEVEVRLTAGG